MSATTTIVGTVGKDPELRFTASGQATTTFGVAVNRRWQNRQTQEWEESVSWFNVVCWRELAENVAESIAKGARVVVTGRLDQRSWETPEGQKRSTVEIIADEVGPSLRWASAQVTKNERSDTTNRPPARTEAPAGYDEEPFALVVGITDDVPRPRRRMWVDVAR